MTDSTQPRVLISTSISMRHTGLRREDAMTGRNYSEATVAAGGLPSMAAVLSPQLAPAYTASYDALILSGGGDVDPALYGATPDPDLGAVDERRDAFEIALYRAFKEAGKPVLGICRGLQLINVAEGGSLHQHVPALPNVWQHDQRDLRGTPLHPVTLTEGSRLARFFGESKIRTNSYHHQAIDRLGEGLVVTARTGDGVIEAIEAEGGEFVLAVQWHPEMAYQEHPAQRAPFDLLVAAARRAPAAAL